MKWFLPFLILGWDFRPVYKVTWEGPGDQIVYAQSATFVVHTDSLGFQSTYELK